MKTSYFTYFENNLLKRPPGSLGAMVPELKHLVTESNLPLKPWVSVCINVNNIWIVYLYILVNIE